MVDNINTPTYEQIATMLTKLATNYSNLAILFYDVFYNTIPMDVTLQMYDESGVLQTYIIPNRAKDKSNILSGEGSPEGIVDANKGAIYQDLSNGDLYIKKADGTVGWSEVVTGSQLSELFLEGEGSPEGLITSGKGTLYVDKQNAALYIKTLPVGNNGWVMISANTESLVNRDLSNLTAEGERHFANPSLSNINAEAQLKFDEKENKANKVTSIDSDSTDEEFPSAKAVFDYVNTNTENFADKDLSNITSSARAQFVGIDKLQNGILEAKRLMYTSGADNSFVLPYGTILLCTNGLTEEHSLNNTIVNIEYNLSGVVPSLPNEEGLIFYEDKYGELRAPLKSHYFETELEPTAIPDGIWFNPVECAYHIVIVVNGENEWEQVPMTELGKWRTDELGYIASFEPYTPIELVDSESRELKHVVIETGGTEENWYRLYKDGWVEAGGYMVGSGTVLFNKRFKTKNYTLVPSSNATSFTKEANSFTVVAEDDSVEIDWVAYGWRA